MIRGKVIAIETSPFFPSDDGIGDSVAKGDIPELRFVGIRRMLVWDPHKAEETNDYRRPETPDQQHTSYTEALSPQSTLSQYLADDQQFPCRPTEVVTLSCEVAQQSSLPPSDNRKPAQSCDQLPTNMTTKTRQARDDKGGRGGRSGSIHWQIPRPDWKRQIDARSLISSVNESRKQMEKMLAEEEQTLAASQTSRKTDPLMTLARRYKPAGSSREENASFTNPYS